MPEKQNATSSLRGRIYQSLYEANGFCSKQTLARECGISMPTLYQNLKELMDQGLVRYSGEERSTGGRRAQGLEIVAEARYSVGISVTEDHLRLVAADLKLREIAYKKVPYDAIALLPGEETEIAGILESFLDEYGLEREQLLGVGVTIPGIITPDGRRIDFAPTLGLRDVSLDALIRSIPYPVYVENDGSASGHAECFVHSGARNMAFLSLENGIGGAVLIGGHPYSGDHARSGEFGHICVEPGGMRCTCGRFGCLEAYCSANRVDRVLHVSLEDFFRGVEEHIPEYEALFYDMLRHLAIGVNNIHMVLDCDVVLGGFFSEYLQPYMPALRQYVSAGNALEENADFVSLSSLRRHIAPLGAALYFIRRFVSSV